MGFLRRIAIILGFLKNDDHAAAGEGENLVGKSVPRRPAGGFGVQIPAGSNKPSVGSIFIPCSFGNGGIQGLSWYSRRLRVDDDGDVADEFLDEVISPMGFGEQDRATQFWFVLRYSTKPSLVKRQTIAMNGNIHHCMEYHGMLHWV